MARRPPSPSISPIPSVPTAPVAPTALPAKDTATAASPPATLPFPDTLAAKMRRGELMSPDCPSREVLQHVTSRWGVLLLVTLLGGTHRFSELHRRIGGVSEKMLAQTLRWLEADGFVLRQSRPTVPPQVDYSLTPLGVEVGRQVEGLADWIEGNLHRILAQRDAPAAAPPAPGRLVHRA